ncbi:MAG: hypothetical protein ACTSXG_02285, partial [Alphaproteobacteria bacterium]
ATETFTMTCAATGETITFASTGGIAIGAIDDALEAFFNNGGTRATIEVNQENVIRNIDGVVYGVSNGNNAVLSGTQVDFYVGGKVFRYVDQNGTYIDPAVTNIADNDEFTLRADTGETITLRNTTGGDIVLASDLVDRLNTFFPKDATIANTGTGNGNLTEEAFGLQVVTNAFAGTLNATETKGFINGVAKEVSVTTNGLMYDVKVMVGEQLFKATVTPEENTQLILKSSTDESNIIAFDFDIDSVTAISDADHFKTGLEKLLGLTRSIPASFVSKSELMPKLKFISNIGTNANDYMLRYDVHTSMNENIGVFKLSDGINTWTKTIEAKDNTTTALHFGNGVIVELTDFNGLEAGSVDGKQATFGVSAGGTTTLSFQMGLDHRDMLSIDFKGLTSQTLGVSGTTLVTKELAQSAIDALNAAQIQVGLQIAEAGANKARLQAISAKTETFLQGLEVARGTFADSNLPETLEKMTKEEGLHNLANSIFQKAASQHKDMIDMARGVLR